MTIQVIQYLRPPDIAGKKQEADLTVEKLSPISSRFCQSWFDNNSKVAPHRWLQIEEKFIAL
jgi:hypothetical protein